MPRKPKRPCRFPGCSALTDRKTGYCEGHEKKVQKQYEKTRETAVQRGYGTRWKKVRKMKLGKNPLCESCKMQSDLNPAILVHHIDENPRNNALNNLMSLCNSCHEKIHGKRWH